VPRVTIDASQISDYDNDNDNDNDKDWVRCSACF